MTRLSDRLAEGTLVILLLSILAFQWPRFDKYETEKSAILVVGASILLVLQIIRWRCLKAALFHSHKPVAFGVALLVISAIISTGLSLSPVQSFWGSSVRGHGLLTLFVYILLFSELLIKKRHWYIITVTISIAALAICLVYIFMRFSPHFGDTGATTLNHNVMASWLIMAFFVIGAKRNQYSHQRWLLTALLVFVIITVIISGSRGAILGLFVGLISFRTMTLALKGAKKAQALQLLIFGGVVIVYWLIGLLSSGSVTGFRQILLLRDDFRQSAWQAATTLLTTSREPFLDGAAQPDRFSSFRWFFGYGLDTLEQTQSRFDVVGSGDKYLDRFHNHIYDAASMQGLLGLAAWLVIYGGIAYLVLNKLQLVNRQTCWLWLVVESICIIPAVVALKLLMPDSPIVIFIGPGIGLGLVGGLVLWMVIRTFAGSTPSLQNMQHSTLMLLFSALIAHWIDLQFGFMRVATETLWWILLGGLATHLRTTNGSLAIPAGPHRFRLVTFAGGIVLINSFTSIYLEPVNPIPVSAIAFVLGPTLLILWIASQPGGRVVALIPILWGGIWLLKWHINTTFAANIFAHFQSMDIASIVRDFSLASLGSLLVVVFLIGGWSVPVQQRSSKRKYWQLALLVFVLGMGLWHYHASYVANTLHAFSNQIVQDNQRKSIILADAGFEIALHYVPSDSHLYLDRAYALTGLVIENEPGVQTKLLRTLNDLLTAHPFFANTLNWQYFQTYYLEQTALGPGS